MSIQPICYLQWKYKPIRKQILSVMNLTLRNLARTINYRAIQKLFLEYLWGFDGIVAHQLLQGALVYQSPLQISRGHLRKCKKKSSPRLNELFLLIKSSIFQPGPVSISSYNVNNAAPEELSVTIEIVTTLQ